MPAPPHRKKEPDTFKPGDIIMSIVHGQYGVTDASTLYVAISRNESTPDQPKHIHEICLFSIYDLNNPYFSLFNAFKENKVTLKEIVELLLFDKDPRFIAQESGMFDSFRMSPSIYSHYSKDLFLSKVTPGMRTHYGEAISDFLLLMDSIESYILTHNSPAPKIFL